MLQSSYIVLESAAPLCLKSADAELDHEQKEAAVQVKLAAFNIDKI